MADLRADVIVIGAGAFGAWTALSLQERGVQVLLVDAIGVGNERGSSGGGQSRNIRAAYGNREIYTRWAIEAWQEWQQREREVGQQLLFPCGSLRMLEPSEVSTQCAMFDRVGNRYELLDGDEVARRWPQIGFRSDRILYEPDSGILAGGAGLRAIVKLLVARGGRVHLGQVSPPQGSKVDSVHADGDVLSGASFVFACGPWLPKLFPELLEGWIKTPRRELFFVGPDNGDPRFDWRHCPNLVDPLGWTSADIGGGVKIAPVIRDVPMDPDSVDRTPSPRLLEQVRAYLASRFPGLAQAPVVATHVSQLENTDNEHFLIDRHPEYRNVFIAGGGSGHAFKMGPVIGRYVAKLVFDGVQAEAELFSLDAHGPVPVGAGG